MLTEQYLDQRLRKMTNELIEYIDLKTEPIHQILQDIKTIKECLLELTASLNSLRTDFYELKRDHEKLCVRVNDHDRILKKRKKPG